MTKRTIFLSVAAVPLALGLGLAAWMSAAPSIEPYCAFEPEIREALLNERLTGHEWSQVALRSGNGWVRSWPPETGPADPSLFPGLDIPPHATMTRFSPGKVEPGIMLNVLFAGGHVYMPDFAGLLVVGGLLPTPPEANAERRYAAHVWIAERSNRCQLHEAYRDWWRDNAADIIGVYEAGGDPAWENLLRYNGLPIPVSEVEEKLTDLLSERSCIQADWIAWEEMPVQSYRLEYNIYNDGVVAITATPRFILVNGEVAYSEQYVARGTKAMQQPGIVRTDPMAQACCLVPEGQQCTSGDWGPAFDPPRPILGHEAMR